MGVQRTSFEKLQRERQKKAKAAAKRARREERAAAADEPEADIEPADGDALTLLSPAELLRMVEIVHERFEAGTIGLEEFEEKKTELLARLPVD
jgi:hypothetical protein